MSGCLFDSKYPDLSTNTQTYQSKDLDIILPASTSADSVVTLFQPFLDAGLKPGQSTALEQFKPVNVKDHVSGKVVRYTLARQRYGSWEPRLEFRWNYFVLQSNFLFPGGLPDTTGLADETKTLYERVHLEDSFTNYFDSAAAPGIWTRINSSTRPGAMGLAVEASIDGDSVLVQFVVTSSPAGRAGMVKGMAIVAINDSATVGDSALERFHRFSTGDSGTAVKLSVTGPGTRGPASLALVREPVAFPTVMVDSIQGVGYISINGFTPHTVGSKSTYTEFRDALLATRGYPTTLIDLRDNGGGSLDVAMKMCDEILPAGTVIIRQNERRFDELARVPLQSEITALASAGGVGEKALDGSQRKYLLLANGNSASASEIFLVAVNEGVNAPMMGTRTYGKGVGQTVRNTPGKGLALVTYLKFTSARKLDYHKLGINPDFPDTSDGKTLLANAAQKALVLASGPVAKISASARATIDRKASALEWNRRQAVKRGVSELEAFKERRAF